MRERMLAVGCGGMTLLLALMTGAMAVLEIWQSSRPVFVGWLITGTTGICSLAAFAVAVRRKTDDDDPFEGERGLAMALMVVVVIAVTLLAIAAFLQPDFWRGAMDGHSR
jgi:heme/copper-type cytochrome/quinol oxidase subunit 2